MRPKACIEDWPLTSLQLGAVPKGFTADPADPEEIHSKNASGLSHAAPSQPRPRAAYTAP